MAEETKKISGKVKWFSLIKGFGYITDTDGKDHFVHFSNIKSGKNYVGLDADDEVEFEVGPSKKGREQAVEVNLVKAAPRKSKPKDAKDTKKE